METNRIVLYHGSYCEVQTPDLKRCAKNKDFGQGFYLTSSRDQAESFVRTSIRKAAAAGLIPTEQNYGYVSKYEFNLSDAIQVFEFSDADVEWLHCVTAHRKEDYFQEWLEKLGKYDVVVGKIADDQTNATLIAYIGGAYGEVGDKMADEFCISRLLPERLQDQYCFKTGKAIAQLKFVESEKVCLQ